MLLPKLLLIFMLMRTSAGVAENRYKLDPDYDRDELPPSDGPLIIKASWNLRSILDVNEAKQTMSLDATFRFTWKDTRVTGILENDEEYVMINPDHKVTKIQN